MKNIRITSMRHGALFCLLLLVATEADLPAHNGWQNKAANTIDPELAKIESDCKTGKSAFTNQQCSFFVQMNEAMRQVGQLIASGEFSKLPPNSQQAMIALVDTIQTALPLMKEKR